MCRLPVKCLSKIQKFLWGYNTATSAIFGDKQMLGAWCCKTPALVYFVCDARIFRSFMVYQGEFPF